MNDLIGEMTLLDLTLPGTHDTLTYNLSTTVSDGGADDMLKLAEVLHEYADVVPEGIEDYIRQQSQTQAIDITSQLNNGIRFIDFRMMYEYSDPVPEWYSLHFMQSRDTALTYFKAIRKWLDAHPKEVVVLWLSKHGSECAVGEDQYPKTPIDVKQEFWQQITNVFDGLLVDFTLTQLNSTSINTMLSREHRVAIYASDYAELTNYSPYALDGCLVDNHLGPDVTDEPAALEWERSIFSSAEATKTANKPMQKFYLVSLSTGVPAEQMVLAAKIRFRPYNETDVANCAAAFNIPGMNWCPETLLDIGQLENYYKQISLEETINTDGWGFPNAIYLNSLDWAGTIRTGTQVLWGADREGSDPKHKTSAYAYADTLILFNLKQACEGQVSQTCDDLRDILNERRATYPAIYWEDATFGRLVNWP